MLLVGNYNVRNGPRPACHGSVKLRPATRHILVKARGDRMADQAVSCGHGSRRADENTRRRVPGRVPERDIAQTCWQAKQCLRIRASDRHLSHNVTDTDPLDS